MDKTACAIKVGAKLLKGKNCILVVDDEKSIRLAVSKLLSQHGYAVAAAENAAEAMKHLTKSRVDLVILDVVLPDGDGVHLAKLMKKMDPSLPIVLFSGIGFDEQLEAQAKQVEASAYVAKTAPLSKLIATIQQVLPDPQRLTEGFTQILRKPKSPKPDPEA